MSPIHTVVCDTKHLNSFAALVTFESLDSSRFSLDSTHTQHKIQWIFSSRSQYLLRVSRHETSENVTHKFSVTQNLFIIWAKGTHTINYIVRDATTKIVKNYAVKPYR